MTGSLVAALAASRRCLIAPIFAVGRPEIDGTAGDLIETEFVENHFKNSGSRRGSDGDLDPLGLCRRG
jgi:hypothetical protein